METEDGKIVLVTEDSLEQLKEYKNIGEDGKVIEGHYASFCLELDDDKKVTCVITIVKDGKFFIDSVKNESDEQSISVIEGMKAELGFVNGKIELEEEIELFKHPKMVEYQNHLGSLQNAVEVLEDMVKGLDLEENFKGEVKYPKEQVQLQEIKAGDNLQETIAAKMNSLKASYNNIIDELEKEIQGKMSTLADISKAGLEEKMSALTNIKSLKFEDDQDINKLEEKIEAFFASGIVISGLKHKVNKALIVQLEEKKQALETAKQKAEEKITELENAQKKAEEKVKQLQQEKTDFETNNPDLANLQEQLQVKDQEIVQLKQQLSNVEQLNKNLKAKQQEVRQLQQKNKELEAKNKTIKQPKQGNGAKYTATVGMGLAAGLIAFTALERTVRLDMLVMIGIAVASALVAGGITYAALPSTQVDEAKAQEANENEKKK